MNENDTRYDSILERYTVLPEGLPTFVRDKAAQITVNDATPYNKVLSIINWLNENTEYSLEPDIVPEGEDFVDYFLSTGTGYCTYYATALAVMARSEGIPSRYVTGFALEEREQYGAGYIATGETAHAWVEVYFRGIGWVEIDPLNWNPSTPLNLGEAVEHEVSQPEIINPVPDNLFSDRDESTDKIDIADRGQNESSYRQLIIIPVVLILVIASLRMTIYLLLRRKNRQFSTSRVYAKNKNDFRRLEIYYNDILKQLKLLDLSPLPGETLLVFSARADERIKFDKMNFSTVAKSISDYHFAGKMPNRKHSEEAHQYHESMEKYLLEWLGKWSYLARRAIR